MPAKSKKNKQLIFLPTPLTPKQKRVRHQLLAEQLKEGSLEKIATQEIYKIYSWRSMKNSPAKRLYKNYSLVYSFTELKRLLLSNYRNILNH